MQTRYLESSHFTSWFGRTFIINAPEPLNDEIQFVRSVNHMHQFDGIRLSYTSIWLQLGFFRLRHSRLFQFQLSFAFFRSLTQSVETKSLVFNRNTRLLLRIANTKVLVGLLPRVFVVTFFRFITSHIIKQLKSVAKILLTLFAMPLIERLFVRMSLNIFGIWNTTFVVLASS